MIHVVQCSKTEMNLVFQYTVSEVSFFWLTLGRVAQWVKVLHWNWNVVGANPTGCSA